MNLPHKNICYICGAENADTRDHLFPIGLFPRPAPSNLPTLPACQHCNEKLSKDEELFRVFIASGMAYEKKAGFRIWNERIRPDLKGRRKGLKTLLRSISRKGIIVSKTGEIIGNTAVLEMDREMINNILYKIAKGLYFLDTGKVLPSNIKIDVGYETNNPQRFLSPPLDRAFAESKKVSLGNGVVTYWRNTIKADPASSITWLEFYEDKFFIICTSRD